MAKALTAEARAQRFEEALRRIAAYQSPRQLMRGSGNWGLPYEEALEMAYENVLNEAKAALRRSKKREVLS